MTLLNSQLLESERISRYGESNPPKLGDELKWFVYCSLDTPISKQWKYYVRGRTDKYILDFINLREQLSKHLHIPKLSLECTESAFQSLEDYERLKETINELS